eukprot:TRINITY_DN12784_c0_g1_i3.p1 TRINITY_DN12784_c0_g1~~TRINITY_DN12784_c0_g1_i3.p1  ORF type:complete len:264 (+),score=53.47 TRINITY_DN12784_c0_g1_i3:126-917(+)
MEGLSDVQQFGNGTSKYRVVFVRHGESQWNKENRFTGWHDVMLSPAGVEEARNSGRTLKEKGYTFDVAYTSVLTRAIQTFNYLAEELGVSWIPLIKSWRLNERHYGALTGLNKAETAAKHGEEQVKIWRRSYDIPPPPLDITDPRFPGNDPRYKLLPIDALPLTECLKDNVARTIPYWNDTISPAILSGRQVLVVAHGNSLRSIVKHLDNISDKDILELNIPTGIPFVYEFDAHLKPIRHYYLADEEELKRKLDAVASQGKAK